MFVFDFGVGRRRLCRCRYGGLLRCFTRRPSQLFDKTFESLKHRAKFKKFKHLACCWKVWRGNSRSDIYVNGDISLQDHDCRVALDALTVFDQAGLQFGSLLCGVG